MVISLAGEWDVYRAQELRERLEPAYTQREVVLDLTSAKYVTSSLISALVIAHKHRRERRLPPFALAVRSAFVKRLFAVTGIDAMLPIYDSIERAESSFEELQPRNAVG